MNSPILIVEDEPKIAALLRDYLSQAGYVVRHVARGDAVETELRQHPAQLVLLDLNLPGMDGLEVARMLRNKGPEPAIIMLTARVDEIDRLLGLEMGADDYICKPFSPREVVARVRAVLRRLQPQADGNVLRLGSLSLDRHGHQLRAGETLISTTPIEFTLMLALLERPERVWSRGQLLERARGIQYEGYERNIDSHIKNLRRKLKAALDGADPIRSVYGVGYGLDADALAPAEH